MKFSYAKCGCGTTVRFDEGQTAMPCPSCKREVRAPAKRRKCPDVILPRM